MLAVHAALFLRGWLTQEDLNTYCCDGSLLGVHPEYGLLGVDFASGSLGQGLFVAALRWRPSVRASTYAASRAAEASLRAYSLGVSVMGIDCTLARWHGHAVFA